MVAADELEVVAEEEVDSPAAELEGVGAGLDFSTRH